MFGRPTRESTIERFIGALTMALGIGALIPRAGFGLYALLEQSGDRVLWSLLMLTVGTWVIASSYLQAMPRLRMAVMWIAILFWGGLCWKFVTASLWGAALQGLVVIAFGIDTTCRLYAETKTKQAER